MKLSEIYLRDPFVLPVKAEGAYYLFGSTDENPWEGPGLGFDSYRSYDLIEWEGPRPVFRKTDAFWADTQFWAPEVHYHQGSYFMLASFKSSKRPRGTQILRSATPWGNFEPISDGPITPADWECLDGTLYFDPEARPWIVFCHEWLQVNDGTICAMQLSSDFTSAVSSPVVLFHASEAPWVKEIDFLTQANGEKIPRYVTDGPFLHWGKNGLLLMLWSSMSPSGYAMGIARSLSGNILGPWVQDPKPLMDQDGGHGMIFESFEGKKYLTLHQPNSPCGRERSRFIELTATQLD